MGALSISHLFFANDLVLLMRARTKEALELQRILQVYEGCSGQCVNHEKSAVMFSKNCSEQTKGNVKGALGIDSEACNDKYSGLVV